MLYPFLVFGGTVVVIVVVAVVLAGTDWGERHRWRLRVLLLAATACVFVGGFDLVAQIKDSKAEAAAEAAEAEAEADAVAEKKSAIADLARIHGVSISRWPDNTADPGVWKIDGRFFTCYAEGVPDEHATELEQAADPVLMCEEPADSFMPVDTWAGMQP